jgi:NAD(P)-dependent dehydrogenase (short-subunit alcohol dehydrogenase family)
MSKTIAITGATSGLGLITAQTLLEKGWKVIVIARNRKKADELFDFSEGSAASFVSCDLSDLSSVSQAADNILSSTAQLDVLLNNAGGIIENRELSKDGVEMTFQMNHLGHFLLTQKLINLLLKSKARIINVSSAAHQAGRLVLDDINWDNRKYNSMRAYGDGKLCNIYFTTELHRRYHEQGITSFCLHPGVVKTHFFDDISGGLTKLLVGVMRPFMITPEKGAATQIYLATENGKLDKLSGRYFVKKKPSRISGVARNERHAQKLWEKSEELVKDFL